MHENRETPSPTVSESRSPAGEGESRTSGMHSSGESDGAVVPMKPSNKATGQAPEAAERVEGRASTKENVQQARAVPAQHRSEEHTSELQSQSNLVCRLLLEKKK